MAKFFGRSRSKKKADINLGIKASTLSTANNGMYRSNRLNTICKYVESTQYDHLSDWDTSDESDEYVEIRKRKPKIIYPFAQVLAERVSSKLVGKSTFPDLDIQEDPDTKELMDLIIDSSYLKSSFLNAMETFVTHNSVFVRFKVSGGALLFESYNPKYCYPEFDDAEDLDKIEVKYVYEDNEDLDGMGKPIKKWFKMVLGKANDVLYDNPAYSSGNEPIFTEVENVRHDLGFVQGQWIRNGVDKHSPDGSGKTIVEKCYSFIDALNYSLSQTNKAVGYGQDPQLVVSGMDEDELEGLIKSSSKGWNLGREGSANFLEVGGSGVSTAQENKKEIIKDIQDIARVIMLDPEKIVGSAQSAKAMEVLHGPLVEMINQMRPWVEMGLIKLVQKALATILVLNKRGVETMFIMPPQYSPKSMSITASWPPIFQPTTQDKQQIISMMLQLSSANILSRETVLNNLMTMIPELTVDDIQLELQRVNTQQQFNTFGF